jgi:hypothetical protein
MNNLKVKVTSGFSLLYFPVWYNDLPNKKKYSASWENILMHLIFSKFESWTAQYAFDIFQVWYYELAIIF